MTPIQKFLEQSGGGSVAPFGGGSNTPSGGGFGGFMSPSGATIGGVLGTGLGLGLGTLGLGVIGTGIGTAYDVNGLNNNLESIGNPRGVNWGPAFANNMTFGLAGTPARGQEAWTGTFDPAASFDDFGDSGGSSLGGSAGDFEGVSFGGAGGAGGGAGGSGGGGNSGGADGEGGVGDEGSPFYNGGPVLKSLLGGPDPKGPDDGYGALDAGEYVINAKSVKKYGPVVMALLNSGKLSKKRVQALAK